MKHLRINQTEFLGGKNTVFWVCFGKKSRCTFVENQNDMGNTKLFITDHADPSVGMFVQNWEVVCPFEYSEEESEMIEFFRNAMIKAYSEFANGKITALYDIEIAKESEYER